MPQLDGWSPGIGDPGALGWITVFAYLVAAGLCWWARRRCVERGEALFWTVLAIALLLLGINKQLDLQSLLTAVARQSAREQGWYVDRRGVQFVFVGGLAIAGAVVVVALGWQLRRFSGAARLAGVGFAALTVFVLIRAASFHHIDLMLMNDKHGIRLNHVLELGGITIVAVAACFAAMSSHASPSSA